MRVQLRVAVLAMVLALAPAGLARAACGVGSNIWEGSDGTLPWLAALTTDIWTFKAISTTFGLAGCTEEDKWFANDTTARVRHYASNNFDRLAADLARGDGEHLDAFTHLLRVGEENRVYFQAFAQKRVPSLLFHDNVTSDEMLRGLSRLMSADQRLAAYAGN